MTAERTGGCLCGAVRYRVEGDPLVVTHCHCSLCRRSSGAPFVTWVAFPREALTFTRGEPAVHRATAMAERAFCAACGSQLTFRHVESAHQVDVTAATLDDPQSITPDDHIWESSRLGWITMDDGLPRHRGERGED